MHTKKYQFSFFSNGFLTKNVFLIILKYTYYKILEKLIIMYSKQEFICFTEYYKIERRNELLIANNRIYFNLINLIEGLRIYFE